MSEQNQGEDGVGSATAGVEEIRLDENGQPLSKNALKKLLKAEAAAKKKAEKAEAKVSIHVISILLSLSRVPLICLYHDVH